VKRLVYGRQLRPARLRSGGRVMIKNEAAARFRDAQRAGVGPSFNRQSLLPSGGHVGSRAQSNWHQEPRPHAGAWFLPGPGHERALARGMALRGMAAAGSQRLLDSKYSAGSALLCWAPPGAIDNVAQRSRSDF
jgi:hypothetical protein